MTTRILRAPRLSRVLKDRSARFVVPSVALACAVAAPSLHAATITWTGANSTNWADSGNWSTGLPGATDVAQFSQAFANGPSLTAGSQSVVGIWLTTGVGGDVTINAASAETLTLAGTGTINGQTNAAIYMNDLGNDNLRIGPNVGVTLSNNTGFYNQQSGGLLTISGTLNLNGKTLTVGAGPSSIGAVAISGNIPASAGVIVLSANSVLTLSGSDAYTGGTTIKSGTLKIDAGAGGILAGSMPLTLNGSGAFSYDNTTAGGAKSQSLGALTFSTGEGTVAAVRTALQPVTLTFASTTRTAGATGNFTYSGTPGTIGTDSAINLTGQSAGFLSQGLFISGSDFAWLNGTGAYVRAINYGVDTNSQSVTSSTAAFAAGKQYEQITGSGVVTSQTTQTITSLQIANAGGVTLGSGATLTVNGILKTGNAAGGSISGGTGIHAANNAELVVRTAGGSDTLTIATKITASGSNALTKSGSGTLILGGANTYTGVTYVDSGIIQLNAAETAGTSGPLGKPTALAGSILLAGGGLQFTSSNSYDYTTSSRLTLMDGTVDTIDTNGRTVTFASPIGVGTAKTAGLILNDSAATKGVLILNGSNTYTGTTLIASGTLQAGVADVTGTSGAMGNGGTISFGGGALQYTAASAGTDYSARIANSTGAIFVDTNGQSATFASVLDKSNTGGLTKSGSGMLILANSETYTGSTAVTGGTLQIGNGGTAGWIVSATAGVTVAAGATLAFNRSDNYGGNWSIPVSGSGGLTLSSGTLTAISNLLSYTGTTYIGSGVLQLGDGTAGHDALLSNAALVNYSLLWYDYHDNQSVSYSISGFGTVRKYGPATLTLTGSNSSMAFSILSGTLQVGDGTMGHDGSITDGDVSNSSALVYKIAGSGSSNSPIYGVGTLTKSGSGTMTLTGANSYTGATFINAGTLNAGVADVPGSSGALGVGGTITFGGGALQYSAASSSTDFSSRIKNSGAPIWIDTNGQAVTFAGVLDSSNNGGLIMSGSGTLILGASNTYTGTTIISTGTLNAGVGDVAGTSGALGNGGTITFSGGALQYSAASAATDYSSRIKSSASAIAIDTNGQSVTFSGVLDKTNYGGLTKSGSGMLILSNAEAFTGPTAIAGGTLQLGNGGATGSIASSSGISIAAGAVLVFDRADNYDGAWSLPLSGSGTVAVTAGVLTLSGSNSFSGSATLSGGVLVLNNANAMANSIVTASGSNALKFGSGIGTFNVGGLTSAGGVSIALTDGLNQGVVLQLGAPGTSGTYSGSLTGSGTLVKTGTGTFALSGSNTYTGNTRATQGTLSISNAYALQNSTMDMHAGDTGTVSFSQNSTLGGLTGSRSLANGGKTLTIGNNSQSTLYSGVLSGGGGLTKTGTGTLTLFGSNTYTGATTVSNGTLALDFSQAGAPVNNILNSSANSSALVLGGATLLINGNASAANNQRFNGLTVNAGASSIVLTANGKPLAATVGAITANAGGSVDFTLPSGTQSGSNGIVTTSAIDASGILGPWATVGGVDLATVSSSNIIAYSGYSDVSRLSSGVKSIASGSNSNIRIVEGTGSVGNLTLGSGTTVISTLLQSVSGGNSAAVVDPAGQILATRGIIVATGAGSLTVGTGVNNGTLKTSGSDLLLNPAGAASSLTVISPIVNGTGASTLTKAGAGTLILAGANTYTGATTITAGTLQIGNGGTAGSVGNTGSIAVSLGATLGFSRADSYGGNFSRVMSGSGGIVLNTGTLALTASNSYSGGTMLNGGVLQVNADTAVGAGAGAVGIGNGAILQTGSSFSFSSSRNFTVKSGTGTINTQGYSNTIAGSLGGAGTVAKSGTGTLTVSGSVGIGGLAANSGVVQLTQSGTIGAISIGASGAVALSANGVNSAKVLDTSSLLIAAGGKLDLSDNGMILRDQSAGGNQAANLAMVQGLVNAASDNGNWDKPGITSSTVVADLSAYSVLTIMVYDNTILGVDSFEGINNLQTDNGGNQVILKTTYVGDFDGNGIVNSADYGWLDFYYGYGLTVGDLNGDGQVNSADYNGIDYGYGYQAYGVLAGEGMTGAVMPAGSSVSTGIASSAAPEPAPEPATWALVASALSMLLGRRRRQPLNQQPPSTRTARNPRITA